MENAWLNEKPPEDGGSRKPNNHQMEQSDSSASSMDETSQSHTMIVERDSSEAGAVDTKIDANEVRAMSPRRNRDDIEALGKEAREELRRSVLGRLSVTEGQ